MLKSAAVIFGVVLVLIGIAGFVPVITIPPADGEPAKLLGAFAVDPIHNFVHILTGVAALIVGLISEQASRGYFRVIAVVYAVAAVAGFFAGYGTLLGMAYNYADAFLHLSIALIALALGFALRPRQDAAIYRRAA